MSEADRGALLFSCPVKWNLSVSELFVIRYFRFFLSEESA